MSLNNAHSTGRRCQDKFSLDNCNAKYCIPSSNPMEQPKLHVPLVFPCSLGEKGSSVARLSEAKTRASLYKKLEIVDASVRELLASIKKRFSDVVTFNGRPYHEKMDWDRCVQPLVLEIAPELQTKSQYSNQQFLYITCHHLYCYAADNSFYQSESGSVFWRILTQSGIRNSCQALSLGL